MTHGARWPWLVLAALALVVACGFALRQKSIDVLRTELNLAREESRELARLRDENRQLKEKPISPGELERLRARHVSLERLRGEVEDLRARAEQMARRAPTSDSAGGSLGTVSNWKNVGRATPDKLMETLLWASAAGDVATIENAIIFDGAGRARAEAMLARLPEATRAEYRSPEKLIALLLAKEGTAFSSVEIMGRTNRGPEEVALRVRVEYAEPRPAGETSFPMRRDAEGWKLLVPADVVGRYAGLLAGAPASVK